MTWNAKETDADAVSLHLSYLTITHAKFFVADFFISPPTTER